MKKQPVSAVLCEKKAECICERKVSTNVSLRSPRRLTWVETFRFIKIFCMSRDHSISRLSRLFDKMNSMGLQAGDVLLGIIHRRDTFSPLLPEQGLYREYVYSVDVYQKYLMRLGELKIFEP